MTVRISRGQHTHQTAIANDPTKDISANQWNDIAGPTYAHIETGMFGTPASVAYIQLDASGVAIPVDTHTIIAAHTSPGSGTDTLKNITNTNTNAKDHLYLLANSGDTITVSHNDSSTGNIFLRGAVNKVLSSTVPMLLFRVGTNWYEYNQSTLLVNAEVSASAAIAYSKLNLATSILNADIATSAAIAYSKLNLASSVVNADIASGAAIALSKLASNANLVLNSGQGVVDENANLYVKYVKVASAVNYLKITNAATGTNVLISPDGDSNLGITYSPKGTGEIFGTMELLTFPIGDESTVPGATTNTFVKKITWIAPRAGKIVWVEVGCTVAPNATVTFEIQQGGSTILSTRPTIVSSAKAGSNGVLTSTPTTVSKGDVIDFGYWNVPSSPAIAGAKITIGFYRTA